MTVRMISLPTIDHETVSLVEPSWCAGHANHVPEYRVDLCHTGPEHDLTFDGAAFLTTALTQDPYAIDPERRRTGLYVEQADFSATLDPAEVRQLAATLTVHAMHLRTLADQLTAIRAEERAQ
ncbi:DUF6907 domain-containing protein [Streptomyces sp. NPDC006477]|uniref:DUF6907 domain-containing protein n=1 Tax=Streptomyces sp. NPDC006477 TaxID=3364747 RepID=UPI0036A8D973